jgi:hypothetical protein
VMTLPLLPILVSLRMHRGGCSGRVKQSSIDREEGWQAVVAGGGRRWQGFGEIVPISDIESVDAHE